MTTGQTIVDLRKMRNAVARRLGLVFSAVNPLFVLSTMFTPEMAKSLADHRREMLDEPESEDDEEFDTGFIKIIHEDFFGALLPHPYGSNIESRFNQIQKLSAHDYDMLSAAEVPSLSDWTEEELGFVVTRYQNQITMATHRLRDIHTIWKYLTGDEYPMPSFIKSSVMGMFGKADADHGFVYTDDDFKYRTRPNVMTAKWLTPFIGFNHAKVIEDALAVIGDVSKPREGEPDTLSFFGSNVTNEIKIF